MAATAAAAAAAAAATAAVAAAAVYFLDVYRRLSMFRVLSCFLSIKLLNQCFLNNSLYFASYGVFEGTTTSAPHFCFSVS